MCQPTAGRARAGEMEKKNAFFLSRRVGLRSEPSFYLAAGEGQSPLSASACGRAWLLSGGGRFPYPKRERGERTPLSSPPRQAAPGGDGELAETSVVETRESPFGTNDPQTGVALGSSPGPQCAFEMSMLMCPAVHTTTRSLLRLSSTHEPSDPPLRVIITHRQYCQFGVKHTPV